METWRMFATGLLAVAGLILVLAAMAQVRDRKGSTKGQVNRVALIGLAVLSIAVALVATVLPETFAWALAAGTGLIVLTIMLVG